MKKNLEVKKSEVICGRETERKTLMQEKRRGFQKGLEQNKLQVNVVKESCAC